MSHWSPYSENGGSLVAIAGEDFAIVASDTRLSSGYQIYTRNQSKLFKLSDKTVLASAGCWCDTLSLTKLVATRMKMYMYEHNKNMSTTSVAQMLSILMYYKRFFPYYTNNILVGLDQEGKGVVYNYDPIGHTEVSKFMAAGSAGHLLQPLLDNQLGQKNMESVAPQTYSLEKALNVIKDSFISATERDIYTGDSIHLMIITKDGIKEDNFKLRKD
ncbi:hypothetical protein GE061_005847 [Apolygus lucorum]|uniref:Uncharacterized protein n=1 Tax=Apolygus lucorum TaxID=248454 RepID=A0A6A4KBQ9_APOLU|nr:hypothetical protein GE061_005847 [Apolygus lucorum]